MMSQADEDDDVYAWCFDFKPPQVYPWSVAVVLKTANTKHHLGTSLAYSTNSTPQIIREK